MDQDKQTLEFLSRFVRYRQVYAYTGGTMQSELYDIDSVENPFHRVSRRFIVTDASPIWIRTFPERSISVTRFKT